MAAPKKTVSNTSSSDLKDNKTKTVVFGNPDLFQCIAKASNEEEGWMKSTKAMQTGNGCVVQVTTQQTNPDGSYTCSEALTFVPGVLIKKESETGFLFLTQQ